MQRGTGKREWNTDHMYAGYSARLEQQSRAHNGVIDVGDKQVAARDTDQCRNNGFVDVVAAGSTHCGFECHA